MQNLISTSTAFYGAGNSLARRSSVVRSGPYSGRKVVLLQSDATTLQLRYADPPHANWSAPIEIADDLSDFPVSGCCDDEGNLYCVYTQQSTLNLIFRKLTFELGAWSVGDPVTIYDGGDCYFPAIARDSLQRLHVSYTWFNSSSGNYRVRYKRSTTDGAVWGGGASDPGTDLTTGSAAAYSQLLYSAPTLYCVYTDAGAKLALRELRDGAILWEAEQIAHSGIFLSDRFSAALNDTGTLLGIAFESTGRLYYIEYDGQSWSGQFDIASTPATPPLLQFSGGEPSLFYGVAIGTGQVAVVCRRKQGTGFLAEENLGGDVSIFRDVVLYDDNGTPQFISRRDQAGDTATADIVHPSSGALVADSQDAIYFGCDDPFGSITILLSTAGSGGSVAWEYFNGSSWNAFEPLSGAYHFDQLTQVVRLWQDSRRAPSDWQPCEIHSVSALWVRARVTASFSTPPVGTQTTPLTDIKYLSA